MIRILHCSDLHLDSPFMGIHQLDPEMANLLRNSIFNAFRRIVDAAIEHRVDLLSVGGDVYDSADHGLHSLVMFNDQLRRLSDAEIPCCIIAGNHDPLKKRRLGANLPAGCFLFSDKPSVVNLKTRSGQQVNVYGISYPVSAVTDNLAEKLTGIYQEGEGVKIALLHCNVGGTADHENYAPCSFDELKQSPFNAWLLGHVHERKIISRTDPLILYPGNIQGRHIRETGKRGGYLITFHDTGDPQTDFLPVSQVLWQTGETRIYDLDEQDDMVERIDQDFENLIRSDPDTEAWVVRWNLAGQGILQKEISRMGIGELIEIMRDRWQNRSPAILIEKMADMCRAPLDISEIRKQDNFLSMVIEAADLLVGEKDEKKEIKENLLTVIDSPSFKKWLPDLSEKLKENPDFIDKIISKGMLHALNSMS